MRTRRSILWSAIAVISAGLVAFAAGGREEVFKGEISDSQCALNVHSSTHSHAEMLKSGTMGASAADCVRKCVKNFGGSYVLVVKDKAYKLDDSKLADKYAAQKVKVTGVLNEETNTIAVHSIEAVAP